jgi:hypothetical protein
MRSGFGLIKIHNPLVDGRQVEHLLFGITQEDEISMHSESGTLRPLSDRDFLEFTMLLRRIADVSGHGSGQVLLQVHPSASIQRFADVVSCFADKGMGFNGRTRLLGLRNWIQKGTLLLLMSPHRKGVFGS